MSMHVGDRGLDHRPPARGDFLSPLSTLDGYEVREISPRQAAKLLGKSRKRAILPNSAMPDSTLPG